ncbi:MAG: DegV family protein, partial [Chloroflexota bacterium]|nr:DegV family protein [Chloroflexota bacterium]
DEFYALLEKSGELPVTSQPSPGEFAEVYRKIAKDDPEILSIHLSSGLSGTYNSAVLAAEMVPEANVTVVDTKTLSAAAGWQVWAAVRGLNLGWPKVKILAKMKEIADGTTSIYTLKDIKYLIHGGRISHIKGLLASVLNIKPIIGVHKKLGNYFQVGQEFTFGKALNKLAEIVRKGTEKMELMRVQVVHTGNPKSAQQLRDKIDSILNCKWNPIGQISYVLGAHTGPSMIGVGFAKEAIFSDL